MVYVQRIGPKGGRVCMLRVCALGQLEEALKQQKKLDSLFGLGRAEDDSRRGSGRERQGQWCRVRDVPGMGA